VPPGPAFGGIAGMGFGGGDIRRKNKIFHAGTGNKV
jgi:hypothetical protein